MNELHAFSSLSPLCRVVLTELRVRVCLLGSQLVFHLRERCDRCVDLERCQSELIVAQKPRQNQTSTIEVHQRAVTRANGFIVHLRAAEKREGMSSRSSLV